MADESLWTELGRLELAGIAAATAADADRGDVSDGNLNLGVGFDFEPELTVISSASSVWPAISRNVPPHCGHVRSAASRSCTRSMIGKAGCAVGPWPRRGTDGALGAGGVGRGRCSDDAPKRARSR